MRILGFLLILIVAAVSAANVLSKVNYSFIKPNEKSFVYANNITPLTISVDVSTFDQGATLALKFFTDAEASLPVSASSACVASDNTVLFDETLMATSTITSAKSCTFKAYITSSSVDQVFTKLGMDLASASTVASFTTASSSFSGEWSAKIVKAGDVVRLSVESNVLFAKDDTFTITASNGAPFTTATACLSDGVPLFLVSAQGTRLLFSAKGPLTSAFLCSLEVTAAPTGIELSEYIFMAPSHGITSTLPAFITPLDKDGYTIRVGLVNHGRLPRAIEATDNVLYLGIPAAAVRAGDTIKMYNYEFSKVALSTCTYKNGGYAGTLKRVPEYVPAIDSEYAHVMTLASPLTVSADNYVELLCPITLPDVNDFAFAVSGLSVRGGVFAAYPPKTGDNYLYDNYPFESGVFSSLVSYNEKLTSFTLEGYASNLQGYNYFDLDVSLRGTDLKDRAEFDSKCVVRDDEGNTHNLGDNAIVVTTGEVRIKYDLSVIENTGFRLFVRCTDLPVTAGNTVSVYDHILKKVVSEDVIRPNKVKLTFGAPGQTQYMASDGVYGSALPFTLEIEDLYTNAPGASDEDTGIEFWVSENKIEILPGVTCDTATELSVDNVYEQQSPSSTIPFTVLRVYMKGHSTQCTGLAKLYPAYMGDSSKNRIKVSSSDSEIVSRDAAVFQSLYTFLPKMIPYWDFSFYNPALTLGTASNFSIGHGVLPTGATVTLNFDHDIAMETGTCKNDASDVILVCSIAENKRSLTCTKQQYEYLDQCRLLLTFAPDFARTILVTTSFTGLADGVVLNPPFVLKAAGAQGSVSVISSSTVGNEVAIRIRFPNIARKTDIIRVSGLSGSYGTMTFRRLQVGGSIVSTTATVLDGAVDIPLTSIDAAAVQEIDVYFMHYAGLGAFTAQSYTLTASRVQGEELVGSATVNLLQNSLYVSAIPSAKSSLYNIVKIGHPDMNEGDSIQINSLTYPIGSEPYMRCEGLVDPIVAVDNTFTLPTGTSVLSTKFCYIILSSYTLGLPYWSVSAYVGAATFHYAIAAATQETAPPQVVSNTQLYKGVQATATLYLYDFTSALPVNGETTIDITYDTTKMSISAMNCDSRTVTLDNTAGSISIDYASGPVPLANYYRYSCSITLTPLVSVESHKFTSASILGKAVDIALPSFKDLTPSIAVSFPTAVVKAVTNTVRFSISQIAFAVGDTIEFVNPLTGDFITLSSCAGLTLDSNKITFAEARSASIAATTHDCAFTPNYESDTPINFKVRVTRADAAATPKTIDFDAVAPETVQNGFHISYASQNGNTLVYTLTYYENDYSEMYKDIYLDNPYYSDVQLETTCPLDYKESQRITVYKYVTPQSPFLKCEVHIVFKTTYDPTMYANKMTLTDHSLVNLEVPAVTLPEPAVAAYIDGNRVRFSFSSTDANTVTIDNIWGIAADAAKPIKVFAIVGETEVGQVTVDGAVLRVSYQPGFVTENNGKYTASGAFFDLPSLHGHILKSLDPEVKIVVGSVSVIFEYWTTPYEISWNVPDAKLTPGEQYEIMMHMNIGGNLAKFHLNHADTGLSSVASCATVSKISSPSVYDTPVTLTIDGSSFSFALTDTNTIPEHGLDLKCIFNTISAEQAKKKTASYAKTITVSIKTLSNVDLFSSSVNIAAPFFAPINAVTQVVYFQRSTLFTSSELATLATSYASGLRVKVPALADSQVAVSGQEIETSSLEPVDVVPNPIASKFTVNAETTIAVTFTTTSTASASVSTDDVDGAVGDITGAFSAYTVTVKPAADAIIDGECANRCGLGCALCADGEACSVNEDCLGGNCNASGVCGDDSGTPDPENPDNSASTTSLALVAVVALVSALILF